MLDSRGSPGANRVSPRTELALYLSSFGIYPDPPQRSRDELAAFRVAFVEAVSQVLDGEGEREGERTLVRSDSPSARVAHQHEEAEGSRRCHRSLEAGQARLRAGNAYVGRRGPHEGRRTAIPGGYLFQHRLLQAEAVLGVIQMLYDQKLHNAKVPSQ